MFKETNYELYRAALDCYRKAEYYYGLRSCGYSDYAAELEELGDSMVEELQARFALLSDPHPEPQVVLTRKILKVNVGDERSKLYDQIEDCIEARKNLRTYLAHLRTLVW